MKMPSQLHTSALSIEEHYTEQQSKFYGTASNRTVLTAFYALIALVSGGLMKLSTDSESFSFICCYMDS